MPDGGLAPLEPDFALPLEPMFGHGCPLDDPDFSPGACGGVDFWLGACVLEDVEFDAPDDDALVVLVVVVAAASLPLAVVFVSWVVVGEAAAPAMPAAAPPVASAPATMVAPSILEMDIGGTSWGSGLGCADHAGGAR